MQVETTRTPAAIVTEIHSAFDDVPRPARIADMLMGPYQGNDDAYMLAAEFVAKPWQEVPLGRLVFHGDFLGCLSAAGYRAALPAYLMGCVTEGPDADSCRGEIVGSLWPTLKAWPHQSEARRALAPERLSGLDRAQRAAVGSVLRYLVAVWGHSEAAEILEEW